MRKNSNKKKLTLPHEDLAFSDVGLSFLASAYNSSAKPQEQSLQAFLFPVVPQTEVNCLSIRGDR